MRITAPFFVTLATMALALPRPDPPEGLPVGMTEGGSGTHCVNSGVPCCEPLAEGGTVCVSDSISKARTR